MEDLADSYHIGRGKQCESNCGAVVAKQQATSLSSSAGPEPSIFLYLHADFVVYRCRAALKLIPLSIIRVCICACMWRALCLLDRQEAAGCRSGVSVRRGGGRRRGCE